MKLSLQPKLVEALRKKERQDKTQFTTKIGGGAQEKKKDRMKLSLQPKLVEARSGKKKDRMKLSLQPKFLVGGAQEKRKKG